jgi:serine/threonine-protein kinase
MSRVYKAMDNETGKTVCLKVQDRERNEAALARASRHEARPLEGEIASRVVHPNVIRTLEHGTTAAGEHYIVMEFVNGVSFDRVQEARLGRTAERVEWIAQAADGLAAVHEAGFIHHDVNPRNFLINRDQQVKLIDFGLAVPNTPAFRKPGNRTGCLLYMAPELLRREPIDERIDVFSLGVVAFRLLTERMPFDAPSSANTLLQRFSLPANDPAQLKPKLSDELCEVLRSLVAVNRRDRWPRLATLSETLRSIPVKRRPL